MPLATRFDSECNLGVLIYSEDVTGGGLLDPCDESGGCLFALEVDAPVLIRCRLAEVLEPDRYALVVYDP